MLNKGLVASCDLSKENPIRPIVGGDMVGYQKKQVLVKIEPYQSRAQHRIPRQIEPAAGYFSEPRLQFRLSLHRAAPAQVDQRQLHRPRFVHHLRRLLMDGNKRRPQNLMPRDDRVKRLLQRGDIQFARQAHERGLVISRIFRLQPMQEP